VQKPQWILSDSTCKFPQGWCAYAYYASDPFILASNVPGLLVSLWLNIGAAKLQYLQLRQERNQNENMNPAELSKRDESFILVSQEVMLLRILIVWLLILVCVGWLGFANGREQQVLGVLANINVIFFYGAPLQTMQTVIEDKSSESIHVPTMIMSLLNTTFWILYGLAKHSPVIYFPNIIGIFLGALQGFMCLLYPMRQQMDLDMSPLLSEFEVNTNESTISPPMTEGFPGDLL
jgi:uncharacterized protein with PQ loop repeat